MWRVHFSVNQTYSKLQMWTFLTVYKVLNLLLRNISVRFASRISHTTAFCYILLLSTESNIFLSLFYRISEKKMVVSERFLIETEDYSIKRYLDSKITMALKLFMVNLKTRNSKNELRPAKRPDVSVNVNRFYFLISQINVISWHSCFVFTIFFFCSDFSQIYLILLFIYTFLSTKLLCLNPASMRDGRLCRADYELCLSLRLAICYVPMPRKHI